MARASRSARLCACRTASAAVSVGEASLFALGLVDGTVLVLDARLGTVAARLDRLGAVAPPTETLSESLFATEATARASLPRLRDGTDDADGSFGDKAPDGDGPPARTSLTSLTACVALAFIPGRDDEKASVADTVELAAASAAGWTATFPFPVAPGSTLPKNPPASRFVKPRGDAHVAKTLTCQRGGPFCVVEGDAPDTRRARASISEDASDASERHFGDASGSEPERDDDASSASKVSSKEEAKKTFVRAMDLTGARDLYGVFCPPERCAFALDASGRTIHCFDGSETAVVVARERRETRGRREEEARAEEDLRKRDEKVQRLHEEAGEINDALDELEREAGESETRLRDVARRAEETHTELMAAQDAYRAAKGLPLDGDVLGPEELDMRCEELREGTRVVVSELKAVAAEHPELATLLASYGVKLPGV